MSSKSSPAKRPPLTHFLSIPLVTPHSKPQLDQSITQFRQRVCVDIDHVTAVRESSENTPQSEAEIDTIKKLDARTIRPTGSIHLTIGVMSLDQPRLDAATEMLEKIDLVQMLKDAGHSAPEKPLSDTEELSTATSSGIEPVTIDLRGLESMHEPHSTSILYVAPYDRSGRLYNFCLALQKMFKDKDYLIDEHRDLRLHATVVKAFYAKNSGRTSYTRSQTQVRGQSSRNRQPVDRGASKGKIDARDLLPKFADYVWAENVVLDRVAICEMGAKKQLDSRGHVVDEVYTEIAIRRLPGTEGIEDQ